MEKENIGSENICHITNIFALKKKKKFKGFEIIILICYKCFFYVPKTPFRLN